MKSSNRMAAVAMAAMIAAVMTLGSYSSAHAQLVLKKRSQYIADAEQFQVRLRTVWFARLSYLLRRPQ